MSILKHKIAKVLEKKAQSAQSDQSDDPPRDIPITPPVVPQQQNEVPKINLRPRDPSKREVFKAQLMPSTSQNGLTSSKNITKNYSTALIKFASSDLATPYLLPLLEKLGIKLEEFREFVQNKKPQVNCIKGLRGLLLAEAGDNQQTVQMKEVFKQISVVFIKYFSVNWIYSSKISDKRTHLDYRFKILRRIKNPAYFTYLM